MIFNNSKKSRCEYRWQKLILALLFLFPYATFGSELALNCNGEFLTRFKGNESSVKANRSFLLKGGSVHYMGNILKCSVGESHFRCFKTEEMKNSYGGDMTKKWTVEIDRISGAIDYQFMDLRNETVERFTGICSKVERKL